MPISTLIHQDLTYQIIGSCYEVFNQFGYGYKEKYYQEAFSKELESRNLKFEREKKIQVIYKGKKLSICFIDFLVDDKVIVEFKVRPNMGYVPYQQITSYLKTLGKSLGLIVYFTQDGVKFKRILNL